MKRILFFWFFLSVITPAKAKPSAEEDRPLILTRLVSHPRNTDQTSLIFRENKVEMVTNVSFWRKDKKIRLGRFESAVTPSLRSLKQRLKRYHDRLKQTVPLSSLIKDRRVQPLHNPHAPFFRLNTKQIKEGDVFFKELEDIIQQIKNNKWICVECAEYQRHKKEVIRVVRKRKDTKLKDNPSDYSIQKKILSRKSLNCVHKKKPRWECVDQQFGIFEI